MERQVVANRGLLHKNLLRQYHHAGRSWFGGACRAASKCFTTKAVGYFEIKFLSVIDKVFQPVIHVAHAVEEIQFYSNGIACITAPVLQAVTHIHFPLVVILRQAGAEKSVAYCLIEIDDTGNGINGQTTGTGRPIFIKNGGRQIEIAQVGIVTGAGKTVVLRLHMIEVLIIDTGQNNLRAYRVPVIIRHEGDAVPEAGFAFADINGASSFIYLHTIGEGVKTACTAHGLRNDDGVTRLVAQVQDAVTIINFQSANWRIGLRVTASFAACNQHCYHEQYRQQCKEG
jgi:hypothetical protein